MKLQNNTAVLRSEIKTQADLDTMAKVAEYQGFDMSCQERLCLSDYASELIYVDDECNCLMYNPPINKILKIISLAEFLSYGKPEAVMSAPVPNIESFEWGGKTDEQLDVAMERVKELRAPEQSWHEKGELPPAGIKCLVKLNEKWVEAFIIGMSEDGNCVFEPLLKWMSIYDGLSRPSCFKPLPPEKTQRELAVEEMLSYSYIDSDKEDFVEVLYEAGYHNQPKVKPLPVRDTRHRVVTFSHEYLISEGHCIGGKE